MRAGELLDGRYELREELGRGALGTVWKAYDSRAARTVAVRTIALHPAARSSTALEAAREASRAGGLAHPGIVTVHDLGEVAQDGQAVTFLVTELLAGTTLAARLADGPPPPAQALAWGVQLCAALGAAHDAGVLHRDVRPHNIMITESGALKLLDFGLGRLDTGVAALVRTGPDLGRPHYLAPERWTGDEADHRTDLYAVGCVLAELLTGARAFSGDTSAVVMYRHLNEPPAGLDAAGPGLPAELAGLVAELLAKSPADRPASAAEVAARLTALAALSARPDAQPTPAVPAAQQPAPAPEPPVADVPEAPTAVDPAAEGVADRSALLARREAARQLPLPGDAVRVLWELATEMVSALGQYDRDTLCTWRDLAWYVGRSGDAVGAADLLARLVPDMARSLGASDPDTIGARYQQTLSFAEAGDPEKAMLALRAMLPDLAAAWGEFDLRVLRARQDCAGHTAATGDLAGAVGLLHDVVADLRRVAGEHHPSCVLARRDLDLYTARLQEARARVRQRGGRRVTAASGPEEHAELVFLVGLLMAWEFESEQDAAPFVSELERRTGLRGVARRVLGAPDTVTAVQLTDQLLGL